MSSEFFTGLYAAQKASVCLAPKTGEKLPDTLRCWTDTALWGYFAWFMSLVCVYILFLMFKKAINDVRQGTTKGSGVKDGIWNGLKNNLIWLLVMLAMLTMVHAPDTFIVSPLERLFNWFGGTGKEIVGEV